MPFALHYINVLFLIFSPFSFLFIFKYVTLICFYFLYSKKHFNRSSQVADRAFICGSFFRLVSSIYKKHCVRLVSISRKQRSDLFFKKYQISRTFSMFRLFLFVKSKPLRIVTNETFSFRLFVRLTDSLRAVTER
jgi:hypothetical protein